MLGMSQADLSDAAGIAQGTLSKAEQGIRETSDELIEKLASALDCPVSFFYQVEREYGPPMSAHPMFRKKTSVGQKVLDRIIAEMNVRLAHARKFLGAVDFTPELPLPHYDADDFGGDLLDDLLAPGLDANVYLVGGRRATQGARARQALPPAELLGVGP